MCDCYEEGREAYRYDRHSMETEDRLRAGEFHESQCAEDFLDGFHAEQRAEWRREEERQEQEARERQMEYERQQAWMAEEQQAAMHDEYIREQEAAWLEEHQNGPGPPSSQQRDLPKPQQME